MGMVRKQMTERHGALIAMEEILKENAGSEIAGKVMEGSECLTKKKGNTAEMALWVKGAMERIDSLADERLKEKIMTACGHNCIAKQGAVLNRVKKKRARFRSANEYIDAEIKSPMKGTRTERIGGTIYQYYTPQSFGKGMRCYCSLTRGLPKDEVISRTYCLCSKGFVEKVWEAVYGKPVQVKFIHSAISGEKECKFKIG
jgi:hypothetical protein